MRVTNYAIVVAYNGSDISAVELEQCHVPESKFKRLPMHALRK